MTAGPRTFAVIPAHDEAATVADVVRRAARHVDRVLVVDDGSTDDTGALAAGAGATVLRLDPNRGKGAALVHGLATAREAGAERIVTLDADGEHDPDQIPAFLRALDDHELQVHYQPIV